MIIWSGERSPKACLPQTVPVIAAKPKANITAAKIRITQAPAFLFGFEGSTVMNFFKNPIKAKNIKPITNARARYFNAYLGPCMDGTKTFDTFSKYFITENVSRFVTITSRNTALIQVAGRRFSVKSQISAAPIKSPANKTQPQSILKSPFA